MPTLAQACLLFVCPTCLTPIDARCVTGCGKPSNPHIKRRLLAEGWLVGAASRQSEIDEVAADWDAAIDERDRLAQTVGEQAETIAALTDQRNTTQALLDEEVADNERLTTQRNTAQQALDQANAALAAEKAGRVTDRTVAAQLVIDLRDTITELEAYKAAHPDRPPTTTEGRVIPADALRFHPDGNDANPGTEAKPRKTAKPDAYNVMLGGAHNGYAQFLPDGTRTTIHVPDGQTAVMDGQGAKARALKAGGLLNLYGNGVITGYNTPYSKDTNAAAVYFGGTAAGSEIDGWTIEHCAMAGLATQVPLKFTKLLVQDVGYSGILGTTADGTTFGKVRVLRINRNGVAQDGQLGAIKVTRSKDVMFSKDVYVEDTGGAVGLWCDVSCRTPHFTGSRVKTGAGKVASIGLLFEQTQGGTVTGVDIEGIEALRVAATGGLKIWDSKFVGTSIAARLWQDRNRNSGTQPANLPPTDAPWWTIDNEIGNTELTAIGGLKIALTAYSSGDAKGQVLGKDMAALRGNRYNGSIKLGDSTGTQITHTLPMLAAALGNRYTA